MCRFSCLEDGQKYLEIFQCDAVDYGYDRLEMVNNKVIKKVKKFDTTGLQISEEEGRLDL